MSVRPAPKLTPTATVLRDVSMERDQQNMKWGRQNHTNGVWYPILGEEYGEVGEAINNINFDTEYDPDNLRDELIQVAAVAVAWVENIDAS